MSDSKKQVKHDRSDKPAELKKKNELSCIYSCLFLSISFTRPFACVVCTVVSCFHFRLINVRHFSFINDKDCSL